jgi:hypothetical protein
MKVLKSKFISMVEVIPNTRILGYRERAWADNHEVLAISHDGIGGSPGFALLKVFSGPETGLAPSYKNF